ncbi:non-canonical purine NTP pyrophosphatase [Nostocoides sp. F2B08]|uniref:non-canonical purine NTP pyrophosphatase n=1 Tax=Nostocoides sp. F2B08 TaxID=2653936 RepID=UPI00186B0AAB|nr:non-canonical purine NTP pyrophosphatase [Tetrasphaera sp. F2B08]
MLYFHTSNTEKFLQARILAQDANVRLTQFLAGSEPYDEDYELKPREMLAKALGHAVRAAGRSALVFVEDTTVRIDALSSPEGDYPGLSTKEWFSSTTFAKLASELEAAGSSRAVTVRSDIALSIPGHREPVFFHGETRGSVVMREPPPRSHPLYTWLTTSTFNGWFAPDGVDIALGQMDYEESLLYDFRAKSLNSLFARVREYAAVLNLPSQAYRRASPRVAALKDAVQLPLLPPVGELPRAPLIVIGESCAGKTTFARIATVHGDAQHVEASSLLAPLAEQSSSIFPDRATDPAAHALSVLEELGMDAIAQYIVEHRKDEMERDPHIITGLRTLEELRTMLRSFPESKVIYISSPFNMRYERYLVRKRGEEVRSKHDFAQRDRSQHNFGLLPVARDICDLTIENNGSLEEYMAMVSDIWNEYVLSGNVLRPADRRQTRGNLRQPERDRSLRERRTRLSRCLALLRDRGPLTLPELEEAEGLGDHNASRILDFARNTTIRDDPPTGRVRWSITDAGMAYLELMERP